MGVFLYFLPLEQAAGPKVLKKYGLDSLFPPDEPMAQRVVKGSGPDGSSGIIVAYDPPTKSQVIGYYPDRQEWKKAGDYYIGFDLNDRPDPECLQKKDILAGHEVELAGRNWIIPVLRHFMPAWGSPLPQVFTENENGEIVTEPDKKYVELCRQADRAWYSFCRLMGLDEILSDQVELKEMNDLERFELCQKALTINYKMTRQEILFMGLIDTVSLLKIEKALFDWPSVEMLLEQDKKKDTSSQVENSDGSGGSGGTAPTTVPPGEK